MNLNSAQELTVWSFSQHYHAESRGEEVIENLLSLATKPVQRKMLSAQLIDEQKHVRLFSDVVNKIGRIDTATEFADGYVHLVTTQTSLAEKVFCFQILTETVSAAFCSWRLGMRLDSTFLNFADVDREVLADEQRHLGMGRCLLSICDLDELESSLTPQRKLNLVRAMAEICKGVFTGPTSREGEALVKTISRGLILEARSASTKKQVNP
jgi:hypothetical protein